jgi:hypothetical protein
VSEDCLLTSRWKKCCCNCRYHLRDYHHCTTITPQLKAELGGGCVCSVPKGWICSVGAHDPYGETRMYSGWTEHGICELHWERMIPERERPTQETLL